MKRESMDGVSLDVQNAAWRGVRRFTCGSADVERHVPLLRKLIELYGYGKSLSYDEKFAAGLVAIAVALEKYDPARGVKLSYWISYQIDRAIRSESRSALAAKKRFARPDDDPDDEPIVPVDRRAPVDPLIEKEEQRKKDELKRLVYERLDALPPRERRIVCAIFLDGKPQRVVAKEERMTQSWVSRVCRAALDKIRRGVEERSSQNS